MSISDEYTQKVMQLLVKNRDQWNKLQLAHQVDEQ